MPGISIPQIRQVYEDRSTALGPAAETDTASGDSKSARFREEKILITGIYSGVASKVLGWLNAFMKHHKSFPESTKEYTVKLDDSLGESKIVVNADGVESLTADAYDETWKSKLSNLGFSLFPKTDSSKPSIVFDSSGNLERPKLKTMQVYGPFNDTGIASSIEYKKSAEEGHIAVQDYGDDMKDKELITIDNGADAASYLTEQNYFAVKNYLAKFGHEA